MPGADWTRFRVRVMYSHDVYEIACAKLLEATITSDLNTEDEDNRPEYMKRKNRGCKRIVSSSEEEEEEQGRTAALRAPTKTKTYTQLAPAPCIPSLGALGEWSQPAGQGFWSPGHISETTVDPPSDANNSAASPRASPLSANITAPSPPQWSPVSTTNSLSATPTDTPTHAAAGRSQSSDQTGFQLTPQVYDTQHRSSREAVPTAIAKEILIQLDSIREQQLLILVQLQKISSSQAVPDFTPDPTHFGLPLSTIEELQCLEETLKYPEEKKNLTVLLGMVGGMTLKDTVGRVLKRTMNSSLARLINWSGANRKPAFKGLTLKSVVLDAVRRNALTKDNTEKEIELLITRWLQLASDRDGGRSQRANRQTMN
ncbi:uncharacterized protein LOC125250719 isoform X2 [Megalobrama amblycephala]|uniref:uncharacterized protein LOC125250719 isoform X1 n=1 Tax=Megalobrama amblycephala TaxID=75352 RepID=UPI0020142947|nr:uncharacterized protein LOC125250719 isoform X1 [Megalobrama amblycephala]XP_048019407.1 uncharacterized protein LOC125250719 isoform X2 [Megalobrama amblycephala]